MAVWDSVKPAPSSSPIHSRLAEMVFALDRRLQRRQRLVEYSRDPSCIFRLQIGRAERDLMLRDGMLLRTGARIARLHYWNEHLPSARKRGTTIGWAREMQKQIALSLTELARYLALRPELDDIEVICGDVPSAVREQSHKISWIMARFGFETIPEPEHLPFGDRIHRFGENILISLLVFARNPGALRWDTFRRVRVPIYLSRRALEKEFGESG